MKSFFSFNLFLLVSLYSLIGSETVIQGTIHGFNGKVIKVAVIEDYITSSKKYLTKTEIKDSSFKLVFELEETRQVFLKVEDKQSSLFVEAGKVYNLSLSYDEKRNQGRAYNKLLDLKLAFPQTNDLNQLVKSFNQSYENFFDKNYKLLAAKNAQKEIADFVEKQKAIEKYNQNDYAKNYVNYALANLEDINNTSKDELFEKYLNSKPVLHYNNEYMNFFMQFFHGDFKQLCLTKEGTQILKAIMLEKNLDKTLKLIKESKGIKRDNLAELYLVYGLFEIYHYKTIDRASNIEMLYKLKSQSDNSGNRLAASNVIQKLTLFEKSQKAPAFKLKNQQDQLVNLKDFEGKPIYLGFWADWSIPSLKHLSIIQKLEEKYGEKIHFVSINLDEDPEVMSQVIKDKNLDWTFLHYGNDYDIREKYEVKAVPSYYLIDEKGAILEAFAPGPMEIERKLYELSK